MVLNVLFVAEFEDKAQVIDARLLIVSDEENSVMLAGFTHDENNKVA